MKTHPDFSEEEKLWQKGYNFIAGIDEVGRGCFAGPLVAAAVILPKDMPFKYLINDSKVLPEGIRIKLAAIIKLYALSYHIVEISVDVINTSGIAEAGQMAFRDCVQKLTKNPDFLLIDAFVIKSLKRAQQKPIVHGDSLSLSIAAASIIAKVHRDSIMSGVHSSFPQYNFRKNKGYGTLEHRHAIKAYGLTPLHRTSFNISPNR